MKLGETYVTDGGIIVQCVSATDERDVDVIECIRTGKTHVLAGPNRATIFRCESLDCIIDYRLGRAIHVEAKRHDTTTPTFEQLTITAETPHVFKLKHYYLLASGQVAKCYAIHSNFACLAFAGERFQVDLHTGKSASHRLWDVPTNQVGLQHKPPQSYFKPYLGYKFKNGNVVECVALTPHRAVLKVGNRNYEVWLYSGKNVTKGLPDIDMTQLPFTLNPVCFRVNGRYILEGVTFTCTKRTITVTQSEGEPHCKTKTEEQIILTCGDTTAYFNGTDDLPTLVTNKLKGDLPREMFSKNFFRLDPGPVPPEPATGSSEEFYLGGVYDTTKFKPITLYCAKKQSCTEQWNRKGNTEPEITKTEYVLEGEGFTVTYPAGSKVPSQILYKGQNHTTDKVFMETFTNPVNTGHGDPPGERGPMGDTGIFWKEGWFCYTHCGKVALIESIEKEYVQINVNGRVHHVSILTGQPTTVPKGYYVDMHIPCFQKLGEVHQAKLQYINGEYYVCDGGCVAQCKANLNLLAVMTDGINSWPVSKVNGKAMDKNYPSVLRVSDSKFLVGKTGPKGPVGPNDLGYNNASIRQVAGTIRSCIEAEVYGYGPKTSGKPIPEKHPLLVALRALCDYDKDTARMDNKEHDPSLFQVDVPIIPDDLPQREMYPGDVYRLGNGKVVTCIGVDSKQAKLTGDNNLIVIMDKHPIKVVYVCDKAVLPDHMLGPYGIAEVISSPAYCCGTNGPAGPATDSKANNGKLRYSLIPPESLRQLAIVANFGTLKHVENSWQKGSPNTYIDAAFRHLECIRKGEAIDPEHGQTHAAALMWNAMALAWFFNSAVTTTWEDIKIRHQPSTTERAKELLKKYATRRY